MNNQLRTTLLLAASLSILACPSPARNPAEVWLALNGSERAVQLVDQQPEPF